METTDQDPLLAVLKQVFYRVKANFRNWPDRGEHWQMPPRDYDGSQALKDDCDGFCLAVRTLLRRQQIRSRLVYCKVDGTGHLVVEVNGWILDSLQKTVVANTLLTTQQYQWLRISGFNKGDPWHEISGMG